MQEWVFLLGAGVAGAILLLPLRAAFAILVAATFLTPPQLAIASGIIIPISIGRIALYAMLASLAVRVRTGEVPASALRPTPVHAAFTVFLGTALALGVATAIPSQGAGSFPPWINVLDQMLFFIVALAVARTTDGAWIVRVVAVVLVTSAAIGLFEHLTGQSWGHLLGRELPEMVQFRRRASVVGGLVLRGGEVRARAGAEFALAFGWVSVILLPALVAVVARARRPVLFIPVFAAVLYAITVSFSRSAMVGLPIVLLVMLFASRFNRKAVGVVAVTLAAIGIALLAAPSLSAPFFSSSAEGTSRGRSEKIPVALEPVSDRPFVGLGFQGLEDVGVRGLDSSYLLAYATFGAIGTATLFGLLAVATGSVALGLRGPPSDLVYPASALAGTVAGLLAATSYDSFAVPSSPKAFWLMVGLGIAFAERRGRTLRLQRPTVRRALLAIGAVVLGLAVMLATPAHAAVKFRFGTLPSEIEARGRGLMTFPGGVLATTVCGLLPAVQSLAPDARIECREDFQRAVAGFGVVRIEAANSRAVNEATATFLQYVRSYIPTVRTFFHDGVRTGRPSWARTAPVWMGILALYGVFFAPPLPPGILRFPRIRRRGRTANVRALPRSAGT